MSDEFRTDMRLAVVTLFEGYAAANPGALRQVYPGRPASLYPPCAFPDGFSEPSILYTQGIIQRNPTLEAVVIQGVYDSEEAVTGQDTLVERLLAYIRTNLHAAGGATLLTLAGYVDEPNYQPDWIKDPPFYYGTRLTFAGLKASGTL